MFTLSYVEKINNMPITKHRQTSTKSTKRHNDELVKYKQQQIKHQKTCHSHRTKAQVSQQIRNSENNKNRTNTYILNDDIFRRARKKPDTTLHTIPENLAYEYKENNKSNQT